MRRAAPNLTHDYKRKRHPTLFAALNVLEGKVIGRCMPRTRHQNSSFPECVDAEVPGKRAIHVVLTTMHAQHPEVLAWPCQAKRFTFHFTRRRVRGSTPWEGYFAKI